MSIRSFSLLLLLAAACTPEREATGCRSDAQCAAGARCRSGVCAADSRPLASVRPLGAVAAFDLVELDGSASRDPDGADAVAEHVWAVRAVEAACAPPEVSGRGPLARVRFGCPGRYEVSLAVRDALGAESEPARSEVTVLPAAGEPVVLASPDVATEHACGGTPYRCRTEDVVSLAAAAPPGLALRWTVEPPAERPLDAHRRVRFVPDAASAEPRVEIETDGGAISGDWIFRVEALDAYGAVGAAHTRVSVRNRPPIVILEAAGPFDHAFDAARAVFTASGAVAWDVVDPDGDDVHVTPLWRHVGDGAGTFDGELDGTTATFAVEVPYAAPEDGLRLRGGEGLSRRIELLAVDSNRALGRGHAEIVVGNRPPISTGGTFDGVVPHRFDRERSAYVATASAGSWADPDGDPLLGAPGVAPCDTVTVDDGEATLECAVPFEGVPAVDRLAGARAFTVPVRDPWDVATGVPVGTLTILNAAPTLAGGAAPATVCAAPRLNPSAIFTCPYDVVVATAEYVVTPEAVDPDGDPLLVVPLAAPGASASPEAAVCTAPDCLPFRFVEPAHVLGCAGLYREESALAATDGVAEVQIDVSPDLARCGP